MFRSNLEIQLIDGLTTLLRCLKSFQTTILYINYKLHALK